MFTLTFVQEPGRRSFLLYITLQQMNIIVCTKFTLTFLFSTRIQRPFCREIIRKFFGKPPYLRFHNYFEPCWDVLPSCTLLLGLIQNIFLNSQFSKMFHIFFKILQNFAEISCSKICMQLIEKKMLLRLELVIEIRCVHVQV
jgi:hypothetical protein